MTREEAIKVVRNIYQTDAEKEALETLVPELKESEDERIMKELIFFLKEEIPQCSIKEHAEKLKEFVSYLERRKEQKFLNISAASEWLRKHISIYMNSEYNEFHKCVEYDGSIDKERLIKDFEEAMQKEQKPSINIDQLKSLMLQYLQEAANEKDDSDIEADTDKWARKILGYDFEQKPEVESDNETEVQKAYREGKNAGRKEVFDHPEYYGLQLRRMYDYETGEKIPEWSDEDKAMLNMIEYRLKDWDNIKAQQGYQDNYASKSPVKWLEDLPERFILQPKLEWSEEDKEWLSEVYFAIDHSMYSEDERRAMKKYIDSLRKNRKTEFDPKPGEKFWVRCKTVKSENLWFDKGDERPAYVVDADGIITYIVYINKDGKGNCVSYQDKGKFLETFEIIEKP